MKGQVNPRVASATTSVEQGSYLTYTDVSLGGTATDVIVNGEFASDTAWTKTGNWAIAGNSANWTAAAAGLLSQNVLTVGNVYYVGLRVTALGGGGEVQVVAIGSTLLDTTLATTGMYTYSGTCTVSTTFGITSDSTGTGSVDDVAVYDLTALDTGVDPKERYCIEQVHVTWDSAIGGSTRVSICDSTGILWELDNVTQADPPIDFTEGGRLDGFYGQRGGGLAVIVSPDPVAATALPTLNVKWK